MILARRALLTLVLVSSLFGGAGCNPQVSQVDRLKTAYTGGDLEDVASAEVTCSDPSDACTQAHLLVAHANFLLAQTEGLALEEAKVYYTEAAEEYEQAIQLAPTWHSGDLNLSEDDAHRNLCESLRQIINRSSKPETTTRRGQLLDAAKRYASAISDSPDAGYYFNWARLGEANEDIVQSRDSACAEIDSVLQQVENLLEHGGFKSDLEEALQQLRHQATALQNDSCSD